MEIKELEKKIHIVSHKKNKNLKRIYIPMALKFELKNTEYLYF